jgi:DNA-binding response OmpR family regulator
VRNKVGAVTLTHREFQIIEYLAQNRGRFVPAGREFIQTFPRRGSVLEA